MKKLKRPLLYLHKQKSNTAQRYTQKAVFRYSVSAATGLLLSNACIIGNLHPFTVAACAALPVNCEIWAAFGSAAGALLLCDVPGALKYISAVVLITLLRVVAQQYFEKDNAVIPQTLAAAGSLLVCAVAVEAARGLTVAGVLLTICESILGGAGAFLIRSLILTAQNGFPCCFDRRNDLLTLLACGLGILSLMNIRPFGFPVANMIAGFLILSRSFCAGETDGCIAGVCFGCIAGLADDGAYTVISCCAGGLLSGLCAPAGKFPAALAYFASCLLTMVSNGVAGNPLLYTLAAFLPSVVFLLLPKSLLQKMKSYFASGSSASAAQRAYALFDRRLMKAEAAVNSFAATTDAVNKRIAAVKAPKEEEICHSVRSVCCAACPRQNICWDHSLAGLRPVFLQAKQTLIKDGLLTPATLPDRLTAICRTPDALLQAFNDAYIRFLQRSAQNKEILAVKKLAGSQLRTASLVLEDLRANTTVGDSAPAIDHAIRNVLQEADFSVCDIQAEYDPQKRIFIHLLFNKRPSRSCLKMLQERLSQKLQISLACAVQTDEKGICYCFYETPAFSIQTAHAQHIAGREQICGDSVACFRDARGRFFAILSDGMGTGERAALDSLMTTGLARTLLKAELSAECTANLINAALLLRSRQETVATLDIAMIDLYTGKVKIYKAGASFSVLQKKTATAFIELQSLPLGILEETDISSCEFEMHDGDCLFLMSDGAAGLSGEFFKSLQESRNDPLSSTVEKIMQEAQHCNAPGRPDDITCFALRLVRSDRTAPAYSSESTPHKHSIPVSVR